MPTPSSTTRSWALAIGLVAVAAATAFGLSRYVTLFLDLELRLRDWRVAALTPRPARPSQAVVVTIGEEVLSTFPYRSPIDRGYLAELLERLADLGVRAVGVDIIFDQPTEPDKDFRLKQVLRTYPVPVVAAWLAPEESPSAGRASILSDFLVDVDRGDITLPRSTIDGTVRWLYPGRDAGGEWTAGFAAALAQAVGVSPPRRQLPLAYRAAMRPGEPAIPVYPADAVPYLDPAWLAGKIALVGVDLANSDRHRTPFAAAYGLTAGTVPGVVIHAHALDQILTGRTLVESGGAVDALVTLIAALAAAISAALPVHFVIRAAAWSVVALVAGGLGFVIFAYGGPLVPVVAPLLAVTFAGGSVASFDAWRNHQRRGQVRRLFEKYVPGEVIDRMTEDESSWRRPRRQENLAIVFTDIAGFTDLAERLEPEELAMLLNDYLDRMSQTVLDAGGTVDKFIGDAVMALFGAPVSRSDALGRGDVDRAVDCAQKMQAVGQEFRARLKLSDAEWLSGKGATRIGVHVGHALVGNFGGDQRFDYTAIGDAVNIAARLEGLNKYLGTTLCVSGAVVAVLPEPVGQTFLPAGSFRLKGRAEALDVYVPASPMALDDPARTAYLQAFCQLRDGDAGAQRALMRLPDREPVVSLARFHAERLARGQSGAVVTMEEK